MDNSQTITLDPGDHRIPINFEGGADEQEDEYEYGEYGPEDYYSEEEEDLPIQATKQLHESQDVPLMAKTLKNMASPDLVDHEEIKKTYKHSETTKRLDGSPLKEASVSDPRTLTQINAESEFQHIGMTKIKTQHHIEGSSAGATNRPTPNPQPQKAVQEVAKQPVNIPSQEEMDQLKKRKKLRRKVQQQAILYGIDVLDPCCLTGHDPSDPKTLTKSVL